MNRLVLMAAAVAAMASPPALADCYRLRCASSQSCQPYQTQSSNPCCCQVNCEGGPGGPSCSCTTSCTRSCSESCPGCPCGDSPSGGFLYVPEAGERLRGEHPLTALLLQNLRSGKTGRVQSTVAEGRASLAAGPDFGYKVVVSATEQSVVVDYVFERIGKGPRPDDVRVEVDRDGRAVVSPLSPEDIQRVVGRVAVDCPSART